MTDQEKITYLTMALDNVAFVLGGEHTKTAMENLSSYVDRKREEIKCWSTEDKQ